MEISMKYCLSTLIVVVQSAMVLSEELDNVDPLKYLLSNETSVLMSSDYYYHYGSDNTALVVFLIIWGVFVTISLLLGCILLCVCKPKRTPGMILSTNRVGQGSEVNNSSSYPINSSHDQPPSYQAFQQQTLYLPVAPVMRPPQAGHTVEFENQIHKTVKPGRIISVKKVVDSQP